MAAGSGTVYSRGPGRLLADVPPKIDKHADYLFYLSGRIVEQGRRPSHPQNGVYEYDSILNEFVRRGFIVISEQRKVDTDVEDYGHKVTAQVRQLIKAGIPARNITVIGASQGSWMAMLASTYLADRGVNFVLIAGCGADDAFLALVNLHGNILSIYERTDQSGTCEKYRRDGTGINRYAEVETNTGLHHGFIFKPLDAWIGPAAQWAHGQKLSNSMTDDVTVLDQQWLIEPYWTGDMTAYDRIVADNFKITHTDGGILTKAEKRADIIDSKITDPNAPFRLGGSSVTIRGNTAVSRGFLIQRNGNVDFTNTYIKTNGQWHVVSSQLADPSPAKPDASAKKPIHHYIFFAQDREKLKTTAALRELSQFEGAQIAYSWRQLEQGKDGYDFSIIREDLEYLRQHGKKLFIQFQDVTFSETYVSVPRYLLNDPIYNGGAARQYKFKTHHEDEAAPAGWMARRWDPAVQLRMHKLFAELGKEFDGKIAGINLAETSFDVGETGVLFPKGYSHERYRDGLIENMRALKKAFPNSVVIEYANFMPGEYRPVENHGYLEALYKAAVELNVGVGGPDLRLNWPAGTKVSYPLIREASKKVPVAIAVQDGDYVDPTCKPLTIAEMVKFARGELGADYIFWCTEEPYFSRDLVPYLKK